MTKKMEFKITTQQSFTGLCEYQTVFSIVDIGIVDSESFRVSDRGFEEHKAYTTI